MVAFGGGGVVVDGDGRLRMAGVQGGDGAVGSALEDLEVVARQLGGLESFDDGGVVADVFGDCIGALESVGLAVMVLG